MNATFIELHADAAVENKIDETAVHQVTRQHDTIECGIGVSQLSLERDVDTRDENHAMKTPFNFVVVEIAQTLLNHGANINAGGSGGESLRETSSYRGSEGEYHIQCDRLGIDRL